jgi:hypothetical protein
MVTSVLRGEEILRSDAHKHDSLAVADEVVQDVLNRAELLFGLGPGVGRLRHWWLLQSSAKVVKARAQAECPTWLYRGKLFLER